jgi:hypothetical protein
MSITRSTTRRHLPTSYGLVGGKVGGDCDTLCRGFELCRSELSLRPHSFVKIIKHYFPSLL